MKLKEFLNHNRYQSISTLLVVIVLVWTYSCTSTVSSLKQSGKMVNRQELKLELDQLIALADIRFQQLDAQDELKRTLFEHTTLWATTGTINPIGVLMSVGTLLGIAATTDNVRARIKAKKAPPV